MKSLCNLILSHWDQQDLISRGSIGEFAWDFFKRAFVGLKEVLLAGLYIPLHQTLSMKVPHLGQTFIKRLSSKDFHLQLKSIQPGKTKVPKPPETMSSDAY